MPIINRLPSQLTYNDLNGAEATEILVDWFRQLLKSQPLLQPHLTLPMAKMTLDLNLVIDMYAGGTVPVASPPDRMTVARRCELENNDDESLRGPDGEPPVFGTVARLLASEPAIEHKETHLATIINASPQPGGVPPDQVREQHGLSIPRPGYGDRDTGRHLFVGDVEVPVTPYRTGEQEVKPVPDVSGGRRGVVADGYVFASEPVTPVTVREQEQHIAVDSGEIEVDLAGRGISHAGMVVKDDSHRASVKEFGDGKGDRYSSVNGVYDAGPRGLMNARHGGGLYSDGRPRISFGNNHRG